MEQVRRIGSEEIRIATRKVKWDRGYQKKHGIETGRAKELPPELEASIQRICKRVYS